jgi:hypothetical protein
MIDLHCMAEMRRHGMRIKDGITYVLSQQQSAYRLLAEKQDRLEAKLDAIRAWMQEHLRCATEKLEEAAVETEETRQSFDYGRKVISTQATPSTPPEPSQ